MFYLCFIIINNNIIVYNVKKKISILNKIKQLKYDCFLQ